MEYNEEDFTCPMQGKCFARLSTGQCLILIDTSIQKRTGVCHFQKEKRGDSPFTARKDD